MVSGRLAVNVLIKLNKIGVDTIATFDFINGKIQPEQAISNDSKKLMDDYMNWLPNHFNKHNCSLDSLENLTITIWIDFKAIKDASGMNDTVELELNTKTRWKAGGREEQIIEISHSEFVKKVFLNLGIPEMK